MKKIFKLICCLLITVSLAGCGLWSGDERKLPEFVEMELAKPAYAFRIWSACPELANMRDMPHEFCSIVKGDWHLVFVEDAHNEKFVNPLPYGLPASLDEYEKNKHHWDMTDPLECEVWKGAPKPCQKSEYALEVKVVPAGSHIKFRGIRFADSESERYTFSSRFSGSKRVFSGEIDNLEGESFDILLPARYLERPEEQPDVEVPLKEFFKRLEE